MNYNSNMTAKKDGRSNFNDSDPVISVGSFKKKRKRTLSRLKRRVFKHTWIVRVLLVALGILGLYSLLLLFKLGLTRSGVSYYLGLAADFLFTPASKVESYNNRTNLLILGKGGAGHEAPDLTDTIIFASISHDSSNAQSPAVVLISLPRDIWIPELRAKLNSTYYWGNEKRPDGGLDLTASMVEKIVGQPVHYTMVVDFQGFEGLIDALEGIEVEVDNAFVDNKYPIKGKEDDDCGGDPDFACRYETVSFEAGKQTMDGSTALKFVRSRNAEGDEGSDFARTARQQKVLSAIKSKITSVDTLKSPQKIKAMWKAVEESVETDIDASAAAILTRRGYASKNEITSHTLPEEFLEQPELQDRFDNLYVFIPREKDVESPTGVSWSEVQTWIECTLSGQADCL